MQQVTWAFNSVRERGLVRTAKVAFTYLVDLSFDLRYGTETMGWVQVKDLKFQAPNKDFGAMYKASKARPVRRMFELLQLPKDVGFVDFGSGKGRVVLVAAQYGFARSVGVEFAPELSDAARSNIEIFRKKTGITRPMEAIEGDAGEYKIGKDLSVFYFYRPFDTVITERVLQNIGESLRQHPRKAWLVYNSPHQDNSPKQIETVRRSGIFPHSKEYEVDSMVFMVFNN